MPVTEKMQKAFEINARVFTFSVIRQFTIPLSYANSHCPR